MNHPPPPPAAPEPFCLQLDVSPRTWLRHKLLAMLLGDRYLLSGNGPLRQRPFVATPLPGPDWVRLRTRLAGICGSDLAALTLANHPASQLTSYVSLPATLGHENVAEIVELGPAATAATDADGRPWAHADRVLVEPTLACAARGIQPPCPSCAAGRFSCCENLCQPGPAGLPPGVSTGYNCRTAGSWGPEFLAHVSQLVRLPDQLTDEQAILVDPLACSLHAVCHNPPPPDGSALIYGAGIIGLGTLACLRALFPGVRVSIVARYDHQARMAHALGAHAILRFTRKTTKAQRFNAIVHDLQSAVPASARSAGALQIHRAGLGTRSFSGGYDTVYEAVGTAGTVTEALKFARAGGRAVILGSVSIGTVDLTPVWFNQVQLHGSYGRGIDALDGQTLTSYAAVIQLINQRRIPTQGLLTHCLPAARWREALAAARRSNASNAIKVAIDWR